MRGEKRGQKNSIVDYIRGTEEIDAKYIKDICYRGLDNFFEENRAYSWLVLFGIFPQRYSQWNNRQKELLSSYRSFLTATSTQNWHLSFFPNHYPLGDFGLDRNDLMAIIHGDVYRTCRLIFTLPPRCVNAPFTIPPADEIFVMWSEHIRRLERILYVFSYLNTGLSYMQGFNELVVPLYYVYVKGHSIFNADPEESLDLAEAVCFFSFQALLIEKQLYNVYLTKESQQIIDIMNSFGEKQRKHMPRIHSHLQAIGIMPFQYALKWFSLMFLQEHELATSLTLWDTVLSRMDNLVEFLQYLGLGYLCLISDRLIGHGFSEAISAIQNMEIHDVKKVINQANIYLEIDYPNK